MLGLDDDETMVPEEKECLKTTSEFSSEKDFPKQPTSAFTGPSTSETLGQDSWIIAVASTLSVVLTMWDWGKKRRKNSNY